jgi:hypothetical protein
MPIPLHLRRLRCTRTCASDARSTGPCHPATACSLPYQAPLRSNRRQPKPMKQYQRLRRRDHICACDARHPGPCRPATARSLAMLSSAPQRPSTADVDASAPASTSMQLHLRQRHLERRASPPRNRAQTGNSKLRPAETATRGRLPQSADPCLPPRAQRRPTPPGPHAANRCCYSRCYSTRAAARQRAHTRPADPIPVRPQLRQPNYDCTVLLPRTALSLAPCSRAACSAAACCWRHRPCASGSRHRAPSAIIKTKACEQHATHKHQARGQH